MFPVHRSINLPKLVKTNLLSETTIFQAQPTFITSNSAILTVEVEVQNMLKFNNRHIRCGSVVFIAN